MSFARAVTLCVLCGLFVALCAGGTAMAAVAGAAASADFQVSLVSSATQVHIGDEFRIDMGICCSGTGPNGGWQQGVGISGPMSVLYWSGYPDCLGGANGVGSASWDCDDGSLGEQGGHLRVDLRAEAAGTISVSTSGSGGDKSLEITVLPPHVLSITRTGGGAGTVTSSPAGIDCGADCTEVFPGGNVYLTATAAEGSTFVRWGGPCTGRSSQCTVGMDQDRSASARFEKVPVNTVLPKITGDALEGYSLNVLLGTWSDASSYAVSWLRCGSSACTSVGTGITYTPGTSDLGFRMQARVTASNAYAKASALTALTQPVQAAPLLNVDLPMISGVFALGSTMTVSTGTWKGTGPAQYTYQWLRCGSTGACQGINGATKPTYVVQPPDIGQKLRVRVVAQTNMGSASAASGTVPASSTPSPPRNTALGGVSGTLAVGQTLRAGPGTWTGTATITFTYQWKRCSNASASSCTPIIGATSRTYVTTGDDLGLRLRAAVTASNGVTWNRMTTRASGVIN